MKSIATSPLLKRGRGRPPWKLGKPPRRNPPISFDVIYLALRLEHGHRGRTAKRLHIAPSTLTRWIGPKQRLRFLDTRYPVSLASLKSQAPGEYGKYNAELAQKQVKQP